VIPGAINASYTIASVTAANAGSYSVTVANTGGSATSTAATLTVSTAASAGAYLSNLSVRTNAGTGSQTLIVGVNVGSGTGTKNVLIRGAGPALTAYSVAGALADPQITVQQGSTVVAANDNWGGDASILAAANSVGAFPFAANSKDAALLGSGVTAGGYSVLLTGAGSSTGVALVELYDLTPTVSYTATTPHLINLSARTQVGTGDDVLITGFYVGGTGTRRLLIRAVGPTLTNYGVTGVLADPKLELYNGSTLIATNDNWDATATPTATQTGVGAFELPANSKDSVLIANLAPGTYSAKVSGIGGTTGVALVEIYELP